MREIEEGQSSVAGSTFGMDGIMESCRPLRCSGGAAVSWPFGTQEHDMAGAVVEHRHAAGGLDDHAEEEFQQQEMLPVAEGEHQHAVVVEQAIGGADAFDGIDVAVDPQVAHRAEERLGIEVAERNEIVARLGLGNEGAGVVDMQGDPRSA